MNANLALYYAKSGQSEPALQRIETAISLAPNSPQTYIDAAEVCELLGRREEAVQNVQQALDRG